MAIKQSEFAKGGNQSLRPHSAGAVHVTRFVYPVGVAAQALGAGDILEIGELPPFCRIIDAKLYTNGTFTGLTADVGLMTGAYGDALDVSRTAGKQLYEAADLTTLARITKSEPLKIAPVDDLSRGIGITVSAAVPAAAGKYIVLELSYVQ